MIDELDETRREERETRNTGTGEPKKGADAEEKRETDKNGEEDRRKEKIERKIRKNDTENLEKQRKRDRATSHRAQPVGHHGWRCTRTCRSVLRGSAARLTDPAAEGANGRRAGSARRGVHGPVASAG